MSVQIAVLHGVEAIELLSHEWRFLFNIVQTALIE